MICEPCKHAGRVLASKDIQLQWVTDLHDICEHPDTCPCQHRLESQKK